MTDGDYADYNTDIQGIIRLQNNPNKVLVISLLNTIQDKNKVQEQMTKNMTWEEVRNIIIKIDNASCLLDIYKQNKNRIYGRGV